MKTKHPATHAFTLVEIMIVVAIIGLLAAIAIPNFVRARNTSQQNSCLNNLRQLDQALHQWAMENKKADTDLALAADLKVYLKNNQYPLCPVQGEYSTFNAGGPDHFMPNGPVLCNVSGHVLPAP
ncbi:MAG: hypothetical protein RL380_1556 [Verrucomicrobiota bacterium]|jgi:prepilin-type N-terminal cleavage/methylation domain-containing protein